MGPLHSLEITRVSRYSGYRLPLQRFAYEILTLSDRPSHVVRLRFHVRYVCPYPLNISVYGLASSDFARHYFRNLVWFLFLSLLRCFSSGGSPRIPMYSVYVSRFFTVSVPTFGYLRVEAYLQLTVAFRSLSRPSSAPDAKAFTLCSYSLELILLSSLDLFSWIAWVSWTFLFRFVNNSCEKVLSFCSWIVFPPFGEIVLYPNWKDL